MIHRHLRIGFAAAAAILASASTASAQLEGNLGALEGDNAKEYMRPLVDALSATLNSSIWQSGYIPKDEFTFQIGFNAMNASFSDDNKTYSPTDPPGFSSTESVKAPTVIGSPEGVVQQGEAGTLLYHPGGFDQSEFTLGTPQLTIGGFYGTQVTARWIALSLGDTDISDIDLFGLGVQHSITQYIENAPIDVAVGGFYQTFKLGKDQDVVDTTLWHFDATGSKTFGVIQPYVGLGFDTIDMTLKYESDDSDDVIEAKYDKETAFKFTGGARLDLTYVRFHFEFNVGAETGTALGLSLGF